MFEVGNTAVMIWGLLFGSIGTDYFIDGMKQRAVVPLCVGVVVVLLLCVFRYFIANVYVLVVVGMVLMAIPCCVRV